MPAQPNHLVLIAGIPDVVPFGVYAVFALLLVLVLAVGLVWYRKKRSKGKKTPSVKGNSKTTNPVQQATIPTESHHPLMKTFQQLNGTLKTVLLAANSIDDLPVTVPIQLGIHLAQKGNCLLIDFDSKRDSIAKVFEVDSSSLNPNLQCRPIQTAVENLDLWPARFFDQLRFMNLRLLLDGTRKKYSHILLYAPYLPVLPDRKHVACCAKQAIVFSKAKDTTSPLYQLLDACKCKIVSQS